MLKYITSVATVAAVLGFAAVGTAQEAAAFNDTCKSAVTASGHHEHDKYAAMASARSHWSRSAAKKNGAGFGDWYYSGDRTMMCSWDANATHWKCMTTAMPCGPR